MLADVMVTEECKPRSQINDREMKRSQLQVLMPDYYVWFQYEYTVYIQLSGMIKAIHLFR